LTQRTAITESRLKEQPEWKSQLKEQLERKVY